MKKGQKAKARKVLKGHEEVRGGTMEATVRDKVEYGNFKLQCTLAVQFLLGFRILETLGSTGTSVPLCVGNGEYLILNMVVNSREY